MILLIILSIFLNSVHGAALPDPARDLSTRYLQLEILISVGDILENRTGVPVLLKAYRDCGETFEELPECEICVPSGMQLKVNQESFLTDPANTIFVFPSDWHLPASHAIPIVLTVRHNAIFSQEPICPVTGLPGLHIPVPNVPCGDGEDPGPFPFPPGSPTALRCLDE
jgi:hypothetical protein